MNIDMELIGIQDIAIISAFGLAVLLGWKFKHWKVKRVLMRKRDIADIIKEIFNKNP